MLFSLVSLTIIVIVVAYFYAKHVRRTEVSEGVKISDDLEDLREDIASNEKNSSDSKEGSVSNDIMET